MRICCIQMDMLPAAPEANFTHAEELVRKAVAAEQPDVVLLPETWNTGFSKNCMVAENADANGARTKRVFSALAAELHVNIIAGSVITLRENKAYNTCYVFNRSGECVASYDKTHLFTPMGEDEVVEKGSGLARFTLDSMSCAVIICYDLRFPELVRTLTLPGLDVLFVVSQWPKVRAMHLATLSRARAIENQMFVALCNSCGQADGTRYGGGSAVIDPWGEILVQAGETEQILAADADAAILQNIRQTIPVFRDRRPELYQIDSVNREGQNK